MDGHKWTLDTYIKHFLKEKSLTLSKFADKTNVSETYIKLFIKGKIKPERLMADKIAKALGVKADFLLSLPLCKEEVVREKASFHCPYCSKRLGII